MLAIVHYALVVTAMTSYFCYRSRSIEQRNGKRVKEELHVGKLSHPKAACDFLAAFGVYCG